MGEEVECLIGLADSTLPSPGSPEMCSDFSPRLADARATWSVGLEGAGDRTVFDPHEWVL